MNLGKQRELAQEGWYGGIGKDRSIKNDDLHRANSVNFEPTRV
jgi:hypothetical protein